MLTPGVSVKNVSFRREGFRKWESMNRKKTKNLLVLMVLSSAAAAGYLVFYNHEPGERELVDEMHIDGQMDGESQEIGGRHLHAAAGHRHHIDELDNIARNQAGDQIGQKLFLHGIDKNKASRVRNLADRLRNRISNRKKEMEDIEEVEEEEEEGELSLNEVDNAPVGEEKKAESISSLRDRLKLRLKQKKKLLAEAKAKAARLDGEDEVEEEEFEDEMMDMEADSKKLMRNRVVQLEEENEEQVDLPEEKVMSLVDRLKLRLEEQRKEQKEKARLGIGQPISKVSEAPEDPFGPDESEKAKEDPFGAGAGEEEGENSAEMSGSPGMEKKGGLRNIADIIYEKKYGVKRPKIKKEEDNVIEPFDDRAFNRKPIGEEEDNEGGVRPVARPVPADSEERRQLHLQELNNFGEDERKIGGMKRKEDHGMDAFEGKQGKNPFVKSKYGGFDSGKFGGNPFMKKKYGGFDSMQKPKNINDKEAFNKKDAFGNAGFRGRERLDSAGFEKKADAFGAFRGGGREFEDEVDNRVAQKPIVPVKKENQFINAKGLLKGGGGNPVIRPFGNNGMNPFLDNGFEGVKAKVKAPINFRDDDDSEEKVHFDFRKQDNRMKQPGLLLEDEAGALQGGRMPALPPNNFGQDSPEDALARMGGQVANLQPHQLKARLQEVPVEPPLGLVDDDRTARIKSGKIQIHDVNRATSYSATCQRYIFPAPVGAGKICIHKSNSDLVSDTIKKDGNWEQAMAAELVRILNSDWKLGLIDIGAGIGVFSLCAAMMHRQVVAIEPFYANYMALHKGAYEDKVGSRITLITQALDGSAYTGKMSFGTEEEGGYTSVHISKPEEGEIVDQRRAVNVTTLDLLAAEANKLGLKLFSDKVVIKLDVTDHKEADILAGATEFFKNVEVDYIMTHWQKSLAESQHMSLMTAMAKLRFRPQLTFDGDVIEMENLQTDQSFIVWTRVHTLEGI